MDGRRPGLFETKTNSAQAEAGAGAGAELGKNDSPFSTYLTRLKNWDKH